MNVPIFIRTGASAPGTGILGTGELGWDDGGKALYAGQTSAAPILVGPKPGGGEPVVKTELIVPVGNQWTTALPTDCDVLFLDFGSYTSVCSMVGDAWGPFVPGTYLGQRLQTLGVYNQQAIAHFLTGPGIQCMGGGTYVSAMQAADWTYNGTVWLQTSKGLDEVLSEINLLDQRVKKIETILGL